MIPIRGAAGKNWPLVTLGLIAVNVLVYFYQLHLGPGGESALFLKGGAVASKRRWNAASQCVVSNSQIDLLSSCLRSKLILDYITFN